MCFDPASLAIIGGITSAASSVAGGIATAASYRAQGQYADRQARLASQRGAYEAGMARRRNDQQLARIRGQYLSSGVAIEGSASDVLLDSATQASLDEQAIRFGSQIESDNYRFQSGLARTNASSAMMGGALGGLSSVVNGFTQASQYRQNRTMIRNPYAIAG